MKSVVLVEVGLRDGLQNEEVQFSVQDKVLLAQKLSQAGLKRIELGAFVRADRVPQMMNSKEVIDQVLQLKLKSEFSALVPNKIGMEEALNTKIKEIAIFASSSESFSQKNINCTIDESFERFKDVVALAKKHKIKIRGYLSTCFGCPYEGFVPEKQVIEVAKRLYKLGCFEVSIGDTIGVATPTQVTSLFKKLKKHVPVKKLAGHFHDTRGTALVNILAAYNVGVKVFDSSIGGLGGCPYAPGSAGNVATEDVVYMFHGMGIKTGIDLQKLIDTNQWVTDIIGKALPSKVGKAGLLKPKGKVS